MKHSQRLEEIETFFHIFIGALQSSNTQIAINALMKDLRTLRSDDIILMQSTPQSTLLLRECIALLRDKIYHLLCAGNVCGVEYFYILLFVSRTDTTKVQPSCLDSESAPLLHLPQIESAHATLAQDSKDCVEIDMRFEVFVKLAQESLFMQGNGDVENILFIELYIIAKALMNMRDFNQLIYEYITLIILVDINIPASLVHTQFIVESFENLAIDMPLLLSALKTQQEKHTYFTYPPLVRRSILNWQLHCFWNVSYFFNHHLWLELYPLWREIFYTILKKESIESIDEAMYLQFFMYHLCGNNFHHQEQWRRFCDEVDKVGAQYYESFAKKQGIYGFSQNAAPSSLNGKKCIAFLRDRIVANSPYKVEYSLLCNLYNNEAFRREYEIKIYTMKLLEKSADDECIIQSYKNIGVSVVDVVSPFNTKGFYNSHLQKALALKEAFSRDNVSILISPNNGYGISDFLLASRSAPLQIYYSHGNFVYDLPCIDARMTHICQNKRRIIHEGFEFYGVPVKMQERFYNPPLTLESKQQIDSIRLKFPKDVVILGSIGRLMKLQSLEYWQCVVAIMQVYPKSIYLACGGGNSSLISECIMECFTDKIQGEKFLERIHFTGYIDSTLYGHIIDIWLDSFPLEQGESRIEYVAKGGLSLMMSKQSKEERTQHLEKWIAQWAAIPHSNGIPKSQRECEEAHTCLVESFSHFVAFSKEDYIQKGSALLELFTKGEMQKIASLKAMVAYGRALGDEFKEYEGINAFKEVMRLL